MEASRSGIAAAGEMSRSSSIPPSDSFVEFRKEEIEQSIPDRFEQIAAAHSGRLAVKTSRAELTYDELNRTANRVAHALLARRRSAEEPVLLLLDNGAPMIASIIGALKAAKIYVPLDPSFPILRNRDILEDTEAGLIITDSPNFSLAEKLAGGKLALINFDELDRSLSDENPRSRAAPDSVAYILYTSGSTGKPKGVLQNHRNVLHLIMRHTNRARIGPDDRIALLRSFSVHGGTLDTFVALLNGAAILPFDIKRQGMRELAKWLAREEITLCRIGPTPFRHLAQALGEADRFPKLRMLSFSGEPLHKNDIELCRRYFSPDCILVNSFGATELSSCCEYIIDGTTPIEDGAVPCGTPVRDMKIYLRDDDGKEARPGETGEIAVKSRYLALGYWKRPELTRAKFLPDAEGSEERVYLTGDLGRMLPDGRLLHLGRKDFLFKIRGYRVEAGEVESALLGLDNVKEAVAVARDAAENPKSKIQNPKSAGKRLIAYLVPREAPPPAATALRRALAEKLPDYMIPSAFVILDALPLTPNGKVDRRALPEPSGSPPELEARSVAPRSPTEKTTAEIWAAALGLTQVGVHDNFFDLGGDSLLATQVVSQACKVFQVDLPLNRLFEAPTVAALAEQIETALRTERDRNGPALKPVPRDTKLPLSFAQQRLWFLDQLEPGNPAYNIAAAFRLHGSLHIAALERSLNKIACRHESLRTTFAMADGQPFQVIASELTVRLPVADLQDYPESEREARAERLIGEEARRPFDLAHGPLLRCHLWRLAPQDHILFLTMHHIVSDGWSMGALYRELSSLYETFSQGKAPSLPELPVQYADYAVWQRGWLEGKAQASQLAYWRRQLAGAPPMQELPTDYPRPSVQSYRGGLESFRLSRDLTEALKALSRGESATLFMTLLAAFQLLLSRYSGQDDIVVGAPIAGRNREEIEGLIGFFLNNVVLRADLSGNPTFKELLSRVRRVALDAYTHQDLPFEKLLEELRPERDPGHTPLFQVYFNMDEVERRLDLPGLVVEPVWPLEPLSKFDFTLYVREQEGTIRFSLVYNADIFSRDRMVEMLAQLKHLLSQIVENPDRRIKNFSLVTPAAEGRLPNPARRLDDAWKGAVHTQFARQAEKFPERPAVVDRWGSWSYGETDARSNRIAHCLLANGIGPRDVVAIYGHRSAPLVWAVLGVLKAGAPFMILDPAYPAARLVECLQAAKPRGWLQIAAAGPLPDALDKCISTSSIRCRLELSAGRAAASRDPLLAYSSDDPGIAVGPDDLAYVAFTSGSTGRPKGVLGRHGPLSHFLPWQEAAFHLGALDRFSMLSGLSHDPLQRDIFTPLWLGATISIPDPEIIGTPKLARWMAEERITFAHLTPAMAEMLTETAAPGRRITSLRYAFFVGDKLTRRDVARLRRLAPEAVCIASYGSTETQRAVGYHMVSPAPELSESGEQSAYPLGRGVDDAQILVLTKELQLAGVGELGEIYLRSPHLAEGYLGDEELTRARFLTNPFTGVDGDRLYRTGDMGRFLPDGAVEFVGRIDDQVKIRGFRVEPGEIAAALCQHAAVREAVVVAREDPSTSLRAGAENPKSEKRLVAYVVPHSEQAIITADEVRSFLTAKLPAYMAPSAFVFLDALPRTPNGKIDRRALPPPDRAKVDGRPGYAAPTPGTIEPQLAEIWEELLGIHPIGTQDNFFDLGGHSLLAVQMAHRIEQICGERLPLAALLAGPTIQHLVRALLRQRNEGQRSLLVKVQPRGAKLPFFFLHGDIQGGGFYCLNLAKCLGEDQPFYALAPHGLNGSAVLETVEAMAASYIEMIRAVQPEGPYFLGGMCKGGIVAFEMARQLERQGQRVGLVVIVAAGARNTLPRRLLNGMVSRAGSWLGLQPRQRLRLFLGIRAWGHRVRRIFQANHYRVDQAVTSAQTSRDPAVARLHNRALGGYLSKPYSGRVALLWPAEEPFDRRRNPTFGWGRVTSQLEIRIVPGGHITCVTEHLETLAGHMKGLLEQAQR